MHHYYRCSGADGFRRPEGRVCAARHVRIEEIDEPVWTQVLALLQNPDLIKAEIERRLQTLRAEHPASHRRDGLQRDLSRAQNALRRLIDGYQEQLITLEELRARSSELRKREATLGARARRARHRAARRRDLPQAHRNARRVPRATVSQRRAAHDRAAPGDRPTRCARGPARRRRHHRPPLNTVPHRRPARRFATAFTASRRCARRSTTCSANTRSCTDATRHKERNITRSAGPSATGRRSSSRIRGSVGA